MGTTWNDELWNQIVTTWEIGEIFTLQDVYRFEAHFAALFPRNRNVRAKLRQVLEWLREQGLIEFGNGGARYKRTQ